MKKLLGLVLALADATRLCVSSSITTLPHLSQCVHLFHRMLDRNQLSAHIGAPRQNHYRAVFPLNHAFLSGGEGVA